MVFNTDENPLDTKKRSMFKAVTWRVTGSLDTVLLAYIFTADLTVAASIGVAEVFTKMVLYYFHERAWNRVLLGKQ